MTQEKLGELELDDKRNLEAESFTDRQTEDNHVAMAKDSEVDNHNNTVDESTTLLGQ